LREISRVDDSFFLEAEMEMGQWLRGLLEKKQDSELVSQWIV
jgi:hypothetical protein